MHLPSKHSKPSFHKVMWDAKRKEPLITLPMKARTKHGLWLVRDQGFAVLVLKDVFYGVYPETERGLEDLKEAIHLILHPELRDEKPIDGGGQWANPAIDVQTNIAQTQ